MINNIKSKVLNFISKFSKIWKLFSSKKKNVIIIQNLMLTICYFFAIIDLLKTYLFIINTLTSNSENFNFVIKKLIKIFSLPIFKILTDPKKDFLIRYLLMNFLVIKNVLNTTKLVRYNILLIFSLNMIQGLILSYWDLINNTYNNIQILNNTNSTVHLIKFNNYLALISIISVFICYLYLYFWFYITALKGLYFRHKNFIWLTDSVAFWLQIKFAKKI